MDGALGGRKEPFISVLGQQNRPQGAGTGREAQGTCNLLTNHGIPLVLPNCSSCIKLSHSQLGLRFSVFSLESFTFILRSRQGNDYQFDFADEKTETQREEIHCPKM